MDDPSKDDDAALFRKRVGEVRPVRGEREHAVRPRPRRRRAESRFREREPPAPFDPEPSEAVERGSRLEYVRPGLQHRELRRLRRGQYRVEDQIDLHGLAAADAERAVADFIRAARERGVRCVRIIHGKGRSSSGGRPILKARLDRWLRLYDEVLAFCPAPDHAGGTGAVHVLIRS